MPECNNQQEWQQPVQVWLQLPTYTVIKVWGVMSYFRALSSCSVLLLAWSHHKEKCFPTDTSRAGSISIPANKAACVSSHSTVNVSQWYHCGNLPLVIKGDFKPQKPAGASSQDFPLPHLGGAVASTLTTTLFFVLRLNVHCHPTISRNSEKFIHKFSAVEKLR